MSEAVNTKKHQGLEQEQIRRKRLAEKETVSMMIDILYNGSEEGEALKAYACSRIDKCPFMAEKTFCSQCRVHCYGQKEREQIREVMKYSGPRMLFRKPGMVIRHALAGKIPGSLCICSSAFWDSGWELWVRHCRCCRRFPFC